MRECGRGIESVKVNTAEGEVDGISIVVETWRDGGECLEKICGKDGENGSGGWKDGEGRCEHSNYIKVRCKRWFGKGSENDDVEGLLSSLILIPVTKREGSGTHWSECANQLSRMM